MEDRIQINGIWYVRENNDTDNLELENYMQQNIVTYQCMTYEDSTWLFEANADLGPVPILDLIQIENKITGKISHWDNLNFIKNFNPFEYKYERWGEDVMNAEGLKLMECFINEIKKKGWLE